MFFPPLLLVIVFLSIHAHQSDDVITSAEAQGVRDEIRNRLDAELSQADAYIPTTTMLQGQWKGLVWPASEQAEHNPPTGVTRDVLEKAGRASVTVPTGFVRFRLPSNALA